MYVCVYVYMCICMNILLTHLAAGLCLTQSLLIMAWGGKPTPYLNRF